MYHIGIAKFLGDSAARSPALRSLPCPWERGAAAGLQVTRDREEGYPAAGGATDLL